MMWNILLDMKHCNMQMHNYPNHNNKFREKMQTDKILCICEITIRLYRSYAYIICISSFNVQNLYHRAIHVKENRALAHNQ